MPERQATVETAVCCVAGHIYLVVQQLFERKAARAHVLLHTGGAVASCVGLSVAHSGCLSSGSGGLICISSICRSSQNAVEQAGDLYTPDRRACFALPVRRLVDALVLRRCWKFGLNKYTTVFIILVPDKRLDNRNKIQVQIQVI